MRVALVHDYLSQDGGAERVLSVLQDMFPQAPTFVWFYNPENFDGAFDGKDIRTSFIQKLPFGKTHYQWYLPLLPMATEHHDLSDYDVVISSVSSFAKGIITKPHTLHICYCHTPTRYLWTDTHEYVSNLRYNRFIKKLIIPPLIGKLRLWDQLSTQRVDYFIANSKTVQNRIWKYYRRESGVITPPVDTSVYKISPDIEDYFITGGRMVPYKRFDLVIKVFNRLKKPLKIFGGGPELHSLIKQAGPTIEFLGKVSEEKKAELLSKAQAFIHPQVEDFGITPIESMASGRPVIAYGEGGATETIIDGQTGILFQHQDWHDLLDAVLHFDSRKFDPTFIRNHAQHYSVGQFETKMNQFVNSRYEEFKQGRFQSALLR